MDGASKPRLCMMMDYTYSMLIKTDLYAQVAHELLLAENQKHLLTYPAC